MDVVEEIPTAHAAVTAPKEEQGDYPPEQKTPELKALGVTEGETAEKVGMPGTFTKAVTPMHPNKYIDLASDDDDPSGVPGFETTTTTTTTAVKLEVETESQACALLGALMSTESRVMDKKDKCVVTSGLKIMQHEDDVMKAMVGAAHLSESVHMLVLKDPLVNLSNWNGVHAMVIQQVPVGKTHARSLQPGSHHNALDWLQYIWKTPRAPLGISSKTSTVS